MTRTWIYSDATDLVLIALLGQYKRHWNHLHVSRLMWCGTEAACSRPWGPEPAQQHRMMWKCVEKGSHCVLSEGWMSAKVNVKWNHRLITKARVKKPKESNQSLKYAAAKLITSGFIQVNENLENSEINCVGSNIIKIQ